MRMHAEAPAAFLNALLVGNRGAAVRAAREGLQQHGLAFVFEEIVQPAMAHVGALWRENQITLADEHLATATAEAAIVLLYPEIQWPVSGPRAIITCVKEERHQFGARLVADLLTAAGWDTIFLGADTPIDIIVSITDRVAPIFVGMSITLAAHVPHAQYLARALRDAAPQVKILAGGRAVSRMLDPSTLGTDGIAVSASSAVELVNAWKR